ncbi:hypothetical protein [Streptomyces sp. NBC_01334]|uniref:hypothetical protein n=1 Tax=Streptomyces sp. NBC_01334 TaxID=2903827 RepID=UPI002E0E45A2|nr:hypothetical protein OG736_30280 [Streptomyces sp. NBC_01334]
MGPTPAGGGLFRLRDDPFEILRGPAPAVERILQFRREDGRRGPRVPVRDGADQRLVGPVGGVGLLDAQSGQGQEVDQALAQDRAWGAGEGTAAPVRAVLSAVNSASVR